MREIRITSENGTKVGPWTLQVSKAAGQRLHSGDRAMTRKEFDLYMQRVCKDHLYKLHDLGTADQAEAREMELNGIITGHEDDLKEARSELEKLTKARSTGPEEVPVGARVRQVVNEVPDA